MKQIVTVQADVPSGWEATGEYRHVNANDYYMPESGSTAQWLADDPSDDAYIILRRVEPKKESRWVNMYRICSHDELIIHGSRKRADDCATTYRKTVLRIDYENGIPVSVTLEPLTKEESQ